MLLTLFSIFVIGYLGYRFFKLLHIPGASVTGSLILLAIVTSQGVEWVEMPSYVTTFFQVVVGVLIGCKFGKDKIPILKSLFIPGIISSAWMIFICLVVGVFFSRWTGTELGAALYGSVPGGLFEMGLIALSFNLNVPVVTLLQFVRVLSTMLGVPFIVTKTNNYNKNQEQVDQAIPDLNQAKNSNKKFDLFNILGTLLLGTVGGFTARYFNIPVGGMLGAMVVVAILKILGISLKEPPSWFILIIQIVLGGYLGTTFTPEMVGTLQHLIIPVIFFSIFVVGNGALIGFFFHRFLGWDLATSLLATATGGVSIMTLTALEINADAIKVSLLHSLRLAIILLTMPALIAYIIGIT